MSAPESRPPGLVGQPHRKVDSIAKVRGEAIYTDDITLPRMLHAKILRSPHAHARIRSLDTTAAAALPGVVAIISGADLTTPYGIIPWTPDEHALAPHKARYVGDGIAAVAALDEETANAALGLLEVDWEVLEPLTDPDAALERSDVLVHEAAKRGNTSKSVELSFGDLDARFAEADLVVEGEYSFHGTTHTPIEPHCALASWDGALLTVWSATQVPHYLHRELSRVLDLPVHAIRVIQPAVGGAFGGKSEPFDLEFVVGLLAMRTGRPVKCLYTREEVFYAHRGRHPMRMAQRLAVSRDGEILGVDARTTLDGGAYSSFGLVTTYYSGQLLCAPYRFGSYRFRSRRAYTNKPACGPKRGHGSVQPRFALEVQLDKAACALGLDPIELRRRAFCGEHTDTINGFHVRTSGFLECLARVAEASEWGARRGKLPRGRGLGVAGSTYITGTNYCIYPSDLPQSAVHIGLDRSGRARIFSGVSEIGQGAATMLAVLAADELGLELDDVRVVTSDTDLCPVDLGAYSSRITLMAGHACLMAARQLSETVRGAVAASWSCAPSQVTLAARRALRTDDPQTSMPIREAFVLAEAASGTLGAVGHYDTPKEGVHADYRGATIGASPVYSYTAHVAEVEVDVRTGEVRVVDIWAAHDCGRALSPVQVEGQIEGSVYMGAAEAVMEHHRIMVPSRLGADGKRTAGPPVDGLLEAPSLLDYRIPTALDTPDIHALIVECPDPLGPLGAREAGEGPLHPAIPAIANAVYDAVGVRIDHLPLTPQRVLAALRASSPDSRREKGRDRC